MVALVVPLGCTIPANPDISGIGVRTAIYAQNLICIISALWAFWDGKVTPGKLEYAEAQTTTNLILAFAILISSIVQARTLGMTSYHANIVLSLSWMNNTNAFVYFILYIHHKIGLPEAEGGVAATGRAWVRHVKDNCPFTLSGLKGYDTEAGNAPNNRANKDRKGLGAKILVKRFVLVLGSLHLTLMAALGIWLWSDLQLFGAGNRNPSDFKSANECALDRAAIAILGQGVPLGSPTLRVASIVIYSLFLIPGVNLIGPMILFLVAYFGCCRAPVAKRWDVLPAYIGLGILLVVNLVFIIDIELTLDSNRGLPSEDEADWGFGQILAILLLLLPLRDLVEAMLARRLKQRQEELDEDLQEAIETQAFDRVRRVIERGSSFPSPTSQDQHSRFWDLVAANDALDYFNSLRRTRMTTTEKALESDLHSAIEAKDDSRVTALYSQGADLLAGVLQLSVDAAGAVLWYAISREYRQISRFHAMRSGQHVNRQGPDGRTALMNASRAGDELIARALLMNPLIDVNLQDASGRTALLTATENDRTAIVKMLLEHDDIQPNTTDASGRTALIAAADHGREEIVKMLLERDDILHDAADNNGCTALTLALRKGRGSITRMLLDQSNIRLDAADGQLALSWALQDGHEGTIKMLLDRPDILTNVANIHGSPLILSSRWGRESIVKMLLERYDIQPNAANKDGWTALTWASYAGHEDIAQMLLERDDVQLNSPGNDGRTPLVWASMKGHETIVKLLLGQDGIHPNVADNDGRSALIWASQKGYESIVEMFLKREDIQPNIADKDGCTALIWASYSGHEAVAKTLLERDDVQPNTADNDGRTPLVWASLKGYESIVKMLLERGGINPNVADKEEDTPLILATRCGRQDIVRMLLERTDIQLDATTKDGRTALGIASQIGYHNIATMILKRSREVYPGTAPWNCTDVELGVGRRPSRT